MGKYFCLQIKRLLRTLPGALLVTLVLMAGLFVAYSVVTRQASDAQENQKFQVGLSGSVDDPILQMGLSALEAFDSTRYALEILRLSEQEAQDALVRGDIAAYVVIPDGFIEDAMAGNLRPLRFVSTTGAAGMVSIFKEEFTKVISDLLMEAQKGVYGMMDGFEAYDAPYQQALVDGLCFEYVGLVLTRNNAYSLQELGIADALGLEGYLLCGLAVVLMLLSCLPFAPLMIRRDPALARMLAAKGKGLVKQNLLELAAFALVLLAMLLMGGTTALLLVPQKPDGAQVWDILLRCLPVVLTVATFSFFLYSLSAELVSGVLLQFFAALAMCFVSGCMYPVFFFPESIQRMAAWLPAGLARSQLAGCITGENSVAALLGLLGYSVLFAGAAVAVRVRAVKQGQR